MSKEKTIEDIRLRAHKINCELSDEGYSPRDIEIVGYYLNRIAASYLSYFTHKEYEKTISEENLDKVDEATEKYAHM